MIRFPFLPNLKLHASIVTCKFCIHLRSLTIRHFGAVEAARLKLRRRGHLKWHDVSTKFNENLICSKVISEGLTNRQTADLISPFVFKKDSRLNWG
jgi:hypothetical protein